MKQKIHITLFLILIFGFLGCEDSSHLQARVYQETSIDQSAPEEKINAPFMQLSQEEQQKFMRDNPEIQAMLNTAAQKTNLNWQTPKGWKDITDSTTGIPTFESANNSALCKITTITGDAGGIQANVLRWFRQINISTNDLDQKKLDDFLTSPESVTTDKGEIIQIFDFTQWQSDENSESIIAGILVLSDQTLFIKMTGLNNFLIAEKENFLKLLKSLNLAS